MNYLENLFEIEKYENVIVNGLNDSDRKSVV